MELQRFYIPTSRQLKRIESTTRSPVFSHFSESITGAASIRAYKVQSRFIDENKAKVDKNLVFYFAGISSNRQVNCLWGDDVGNVMIWSHKYNMLELCQYIMWTCYTHSTHTGMHMCFCMHAHICTSILSPPQFWSPWPVREKPALLGWACNENVTGTDSTPCPLPLLPPHSLWVNLLPTIMSSVISLHTFQTQPGRSLHSLQPVPTPPGTSTSVSSFNVRLAVLFSLLF